MSYTHGAIARIDRMWPNHNEPEARGVESNIYGRHLFFCRFVLGMPLAEAFRCAIAFWERPIDAAEMRYLADTWDLEEAPPWQDVLSGKANDPRGAP